MCHSYSYTHRYIMDPIYFKDNEYIVTMPSANIISVNLHLYGAENVTVGGMCLLDDEVIIRGDLKEVDIGVGCIIGKRTVLRPTTKVIRGGLAVHALKIGDHVFIDEDCIIKCLTIGSNVKIGKNCVISNQCVISSCCEILPNTILAPGTTVPPFSVFGGKPGRLISILPEGFMESQAMFVKHYYDRYQKLSDDNEFSYEASES